MGYMLQDTNAFSHVYFGENHSSTEHAWLDIDHETSAHISLNLPSRRRLDLTVVRL
jgi:hypothetical protein